MKFEKQIDDAHCIPACLKMILGDDCPFTQEEIGFMCKTTRNGTYVEDTVSFLEMMGYRLIKYKNLQGPLIYDIFDGKDDHWLVLYKGFAYDPYNGIMRCSYIEPVNEVYVLERI